MLAEILEFFGMALDVLAGLANLGSGDSRKKNNSGKDAPVATKLEFDGGKMGFDPYGNDSDLEMLQKEAEKGMQKRVNKFLSWADGDVPAKITSVRRTSSDGDKEVLVFAELDSVTAAMIPYLRENGEKLAQREMFSRMIDYFPEVKFSFLEQRWIVEPDFEEIWLECFQQMQDDGREAEWNEMLEAIKGPASHKDYLVYTIRVNSFNEMAQLLSPAIDTDFLFSCEEHEMMPFREWADRWINEKRRK